ncbi:MAG: excinuclease subunit [Bacteroidota bacterium]|nr:excinuclease subunit [Bacteroidota bacterium]
MPFTPKEPCVYILSNKLGNVIYIGVTTDVWFRTLEHKYGNGSAFTKKYNLTKLIYFEEHGEIMDAIDREKQLKKWNRKWKDELIDTINKNRLDLAKDWYTTEDISDYLASVPMNDL